MFTNIKLKLIFWQITTLYMYVRLLESNLSFCKIVKCVFINVLYNFKEEEQKQIIKQEEEQEQIRQQENEEQEQIERQEKEE